jgi:hypothetical protein
MTNDLVDVSARVQEIDDKVDGLIAYIAMVAGKLEVDHDTEGFRSFMKEICRQPPSRIERRAGVSAEIGFHAAQAFHKIEEAHERAVSLGLAK